MVARLKGGKESVVGRGVARIFFQRYTQFFKALSAAPPQNWKLLLHIFFIVILKALCCMLQAHLNEFEHMALKVAWWCDIMGRKACQCTGSRDISSGKFWKFGHVLMPFIALETHFEVLFVDNFDPFSSDCDSHHYESEEDESLRYSVTVCHTLWFFLICCDSLWYLAIRCDTLWYFVTLCETLWLFVILCDSLWYVVIRCDTLWYVVILCDTLWYLVIRCDTLWSFVILCDTLW